MGQSCDYQSSVDTGTFSFKLKISQEDFISKIHQNRVSMLREMNLGFILEKPIGDKEKKSGNPLHERGGSENFAEINND